MIILLLGLFLPNSSKEKGIHKTKLYRCDCGVSHLPIIITVQVTTDGQHGTSQAEALGCCSSKWVWRLVDQAGIEVEGRGVGARVNGTYLEAEE